MIKTILPGKTIGIIGGGQLGRMLAMSAKEMGYKIAVLDPSDSCCAKIFSDVFIKAEFNDFASVEKLCSVSDVITFEFENIDAASLEKLEKKYNIVQSAEVLRTTQHRYYEKEFARRLDIPTVDYIYVEEDTDVEITKPYLMKTVRFGYDGKGQKKISSSEEKVIFNEIAPRVHNSGHITMQSATKSQFRAHIEAICGLKVGKIENKETTLYNILGQDLDYYIDAYKNNGGYLHLYEKEPRQDRKIGHINFLGDVILGGEHD